MGTMTLAWVFMAVFALAMLTFPAANQTRSDSANPSGPAITMMALSPIRWYARRYDPG